MGNVIHEEKSFRNIAFTEEETRNSEFYNCSFISCDFSDKVFISAIFVDCVFSNCNLSMVKLNQCLLNDITFKESKLLGVDFSDCIDRPFIVKFENCGLDYSSFVRKKLAKTSFTGSSLRNVDFTECDLTKATFSNTDLTDAVFNRTILKEADFTSATNFNIDPELNNIRKARFSLYGLAGLLTKYDIKID
ncbi:MAG TPA: pentapeptide repeat-containing protein [Bacteroidales bacterium]|nr:pentapeptide repeat-containing protein [Bacteroidales bacterium]